MKIKFESEFEKETGNWKRLKENFVTKIINNDISIIIFDNLDTNG